MGHSILVLKPSKTKTNDYFILIIFMTLMTTHSSSLAQSNGSPTPSMEDKTRFSPFRPSMAVVVALLTTIFSITFLLLLYAKRRRADANANAYAAADYNNNNDSYYQSNYYYYSDARLGRKNSGIDRAVVESLPVFHYGDLSGSRLQRGGLDCAVCLNRFEDSEILRLLPKCNHAFHVECVDTWLDAHSTCPLCRFRVDPEDVLLVVGVPPTVGKRQSGSGVEICSGVVVVDDEDDTIFRTNLLNTASSAAGTSNAGADGEFRRHSSAGEKMMQILDTVSFRRSLDGWKRSRNGKRDPSYRKDGLLLGKKKNNINSISCSSSSNNNNRLEHRIVVSTTRPCESGPPSRQYYQRWSDVQPSDLLYLRSEMILSESRRFSSVSGSRPTRHLQDRQLFRHDKRQGNEMTVVNSRSASEIAGVSRFSNDDSRAGNDNNQHQQRQQQARLVSRWMAWISQLRPANNNDTTNNHHNISSP